MVKNDSVQIFYPNCSLYKTEVGDMGHHTPKAIPKRVYWKTDALGYRNDSVTSQPDIIVQGDSFVAGCTLSQENTFGYVLSRKLQHKYKVYNISSSFSCFLSLIEKKVIKKPKYLIMLRVERYMPLECDTTENLTMDSIIDRKLRYDGIFYCINRLKKFASREWFKARIKGLVGTGIPSPIDGRMLFFQGKNSINPDTLLLKHSLKTIAAYNQKCKELGIKFIFIPMPNKETVYFDYVPYEKQPPFLFQLDTMMRKAGITTFNPLEIYNEERKKGQFLYHLDDTHWNKLAVNAVADKSVELILLETKNKLSER